MLWVSCSHSMPEIIKLVKSPKESFVCWLGRWRHKPQRGGGKPKAPEKPMGLVEVESRNRGCKGRRAKQVKGHLTKLGFAIHSRAMVEERMWATLYHGPPIINTHIHSNSNACNHIHHACDVAWHGMSWHDVMRWVQPPPHGLEEVRATLYCGPLIINTHLHSNSNAWNHIHHACDMAWHDMMWWWDEYYNHHIGWKERATWSLTRVVGSLARKKHLETKSNPRGPGYFSPGNTSMKATPHVNSWLAGNAVGDLISLESSWTIVFQASSVA